MRNTFLDIIRGISCILIIFIHRPFPGLFGNIIQAIGRAGVAVFFIISGYYAYNQSRITMIKRLPKKIRHVLIILLSAFFYYLVWESFIPGPFFIQSIHLELLLLYMKPRRLANDNL